MSGRSRAERSATTKNPAAPSVALHLAQALATVGQTGQAIEVLRGIASVQFPERAEADALLSRLEVQR